MLQTASLAQDISWALVTAGAQGPGLNPDGQRVPPEARRGYPYL